MTMKRVFLKFHFSNSERRAIFRNAFLDYLFSDEMKGSVSESINFHQHEDTVDLAGELGKGTGEGVTNV
jgi:hypothetical protein